VLVGRKRIAAGGQVFDGATEVDHLQYRGVQETKVDGQPLGELGIPSMCHLSPKGRQDGKMGLNCVDPTKIF
jgi:hypothetical protein